MPRVDDHSITIAQFAMANRAVDVEFLPAADQVFPGQAETGM